MNRATTSSTQKAQPYAQARRCGPLPAIEEVRNCLAPIITSAVIARSLSVDRRQKLALDIIERQAQRLARLLGEAWGEEAAAVRARD
jgi:hypothetical protein